MTWSQRLDFATADGGQIRVVPYPMVVVLTHGNESGNDEALHQDLTRRISYSDFTDSDPIFVGQSIQAMFVMPGVSSFDFKDSSFNNHGDLLVGITFNE